MSRKTKYQLAFAYKIKSQQYLDQYVQDIARRKGFTEDQVLKFGACWTTGAETVVTYDGCGEFADLDAKFMDGYNKEEIMARLNRAEGRDIFAEEYSPSFDHSIKQV